MPNKMRILISLFLMFFLLGTFSLVIHNGVVVETNILKLIPDSESSDLSEKIEAFSESQTGELVFLLTHKNEDTLVQLAHSFEQALEESGLYGKINGAVSDSLQKQWFTTYFPYRYSFISKNMRKQLQSEYPEKRLLRYLQRELYSATPDYYGATLEQDPLFLFPSFIKSIVSSGSFYAYKGYPVAELDSVSATIISASLLESPFSVDVQIETEEQISIWRGKFQDRGGQFYSTGIVRFAGAAFKDAKREISFIGIVSLLGVLLILFLTFRSLRLLLVGFLPIVTGIMAGFTITAWMFPSIHIIALTMGASLTGIAIDYSLHYLTHLRFSGSCGSSVLIQVFPGITLGAVTTLIGYGVLGLGGFPGFQQIAVFTGAGLFASYLTVVLIFPPLLRGYSAKKELQFNYLNDSSKYSKYVVFPLVILFVTGLFSIKPNDDIFNLRTPMPQLDEEELKIREFSAGIEASRFVVVSAETEELLLQELEKASQKLDDLVSQNALEGYISISQYISSRKRVNDNHDLLKHAVYMNGNSFKEKMSLLGYSSSAYSALGSALDSAKYLTLDEWLSSPVSEPWRRLINSKECFSIILLKNVSQENIITTQFKDSGGQYINKVAEVSRTLGVYRYKATVLVCCAYLLIMILLMVRYGIKRGFQIFYPPVLAGGVALVLPGIFGCSITFMHIMALVLVLGIGIDYTIFFAEGGAHRKETLLAVLLSAISTVLAFGVLGLSSTPALQAIGGIITPGIILSFILAAQCVKPAKLIE